jgi:hypothetical protein
MAFAVFVSENLPTEARSPESKKQAGKPTVVEEANRVNLLSCLRAKLVEEGEIQI